MQHGSLGHFGLSCFNPCLYSVSQLRFSQGILPLDVKWRRRAIFGTWRRDQHLQPTSEQEENYDVADGENFLVQREFVPIRKNENQLNEEIRADQQAPEWSQCADNPAYYADGASDHHCKRHEDGELGEFLRKLFSVHAAS
jgi:hypothetical protein